MSYQQKKYLGDLTNPRQQVKNLLMTATICFGIAVILWAGGSDSFSNNLTISLSIGFCIHGVSILVIHFFSERLSIIAVYALSVPCGVITGLVVGGVLSGVPLSAIFSDWASPFSSMIIAVIASYVLYSYYTLMEMREALRQEELNRLKTEKTLVQARLAALQSQIEPHFLFNTLSNIQSLMGSDVDAADDMLQQLTKLLRGSLRRGLNTYCALTDEVELVSHYLAINKIRMGDRLSWDIDIDLVNKEIEIPPLTLQPLVENALVHGLEMTEQGGRIDISISETDEELRIEVKDTGVGLGLSSATGHGIGLRNVKERLAMLYGDKAGILFADTIPRGLTVTVLIPRRSTGPTSLHEPQGLFPWVKKTFYKSVNRLLRRREQ